MLQPGRHTDVLLCFLLQEVRIDVSELRDTISVPDNFILCACQVQTYYKMAFNGLAVRCGKMQLNCSELVTAHKATVRVRTAQWGFADLASWPLPIRLVLHLLPLAFTRKRAAFILGVSGVRVYTVYIPLL